MTDKVYLIGSFSQLESIIIKKNKILTKDETNSSPEKRNGYVDILLMYSYDWLDDIPQNERIPCNSFCERMMQLSKTKYWSREDIQNISKMVGYSVWDRRGAYIDKGDKDENGDPIEHRYVKDGIEQVHCKHQWVSHIVKRKD